MTRFINAALIAFFITGGLFLGMRELIIGSEINLEDPVKGPVIDFVRLKRDETIERKKPKPKKPPKPEPQPQMEQPPMQAEDFSAEATSMAFRGMDLAEGSGGGLDLGSGDGDLINTLKVNAMYPRRALSRGIEGYVIVKFTVTRQGTVRDPVVVEAEPQGIFNQAAIAAAKKYKYKAKEVDGKAVEVPNIYEKITFKLDK